MGKRGPPKTPTAKLKTRGTFRRDRHHDDVDKRLSPTIPTPPEHLDATAKRKWFEIGVLLESKGLLTELDGMALELLVTSYLGVVQTAKQLGEEELIVLVGDAGSPAPNPLVGIQAKLLATLKWCLVQFGCTPSARTGITLKDEDDGVDPMQALIEGR